jgi:hypothetical protein
MTWKLPACRVVLRVRRSDSRRSSWDFAMPPSGLMRTPPAGRRPKRKTLPLPEDVVRQLQAVLQNRGWGNVPKGFYSRFVQEMEDKGHTGAVQQPLALTRCLDGSSTNSLCVATPCRRDRACYLQGVQQTTQGGGGKGSEADGCREEAPALAVCKHFCDPGWRSAGCSWGGQCSCCNGLASAKGRGRCPSGCRRQPGQLRAHNSANSSCALPHSFSGARPGNERSDSGSGTGAGSSSSSSSGSWSCVYKRYA